MLTAVFIVAGKELIDGLRDVRPLLSSLFYCLMGPALIFMVSLAMNSKGNGDSKVLIAMMSVFALVSAFVGGMNIAMDVLAGERERRSLLPLLMNGVGRRSIIVGKWVATSCFSLASLILNLAAFAFVLGKSGLRAGSDIGTSALMLACGLAPLALFAAALELAISTVCRSLKEAHTYLSMLVFLPMGVGMFAVFFPPAASRWAPVLPLVGQQWLVEQWMHGGGIPVLPVLMLGVLTTTLTGLALWTSAILLQRDEVVYGT